MGYIDNLHKKQCMGLEDLMYIYDEHYPCSQP